MSTNLIFDPSAGSNLHVLDEFIRSTLVLEVNEANLCDDSTEFTRSSRDTMACWAIAGGEDFSRNNKGGSIGTKILEEVGQAIEEHKDLFSRRSRVELVVSKT